MKKVVAELAVFATVAFVVLFVYEPISTELTFDFLFLTAGGLALMLLVDSVRTAAPRTGRSGFEAALRARPPGDLPPSQLATIERRVELAVTRAADLHFHLRPMLREIAGARRAARPRGGVGARPGRAARGGAAGGRGGPPRPPPDDRFAPGIAAADLSRILDRLERL